MFDGHTRVFSNPWVVAERLQEEESKRRMLAIEPEQEQVYDNKELEPAA